MICFLHNSTCSHIAMIPSVRNCNINTLHSPSASQILTFNWKINVSALCRSVRLFSGWLLVLVEEVVGGAFSRRSKHKDKVERANGASF